jgi:hypothetical protein
MNCTPQVYSIKSKDAKGTRMIRRRKMQGTTSLHTKALHERRIHTSNMLERILWGD